MESISVYHLLITLVVLIFCSAFFSGSETGMMALNRYRLRHLTRTSGAARRVSKLLERTDRLLGVILIGNTFANILASSIATIIAVRFWGEFGVLIASIGLTLVLLVFAEILPKTFAATKPEAVAFIASLPLKLLLKILHPLVLLTSSIAAGILRLVGIKVHEGSSHYLSREELRTVVNEAGNLIPNRHKKMLTGILDLEHATVEDIIVPRNEVVGIDIEDDLDEILEQLGNSSHTLLPVYRKSLDSIVGILHCRNALRIFTEDEATKEILIEAAVEPYFIPESTGLHTQLLNFQKQKQRLAIVVDEYGDIKGIITLEDILEEIVGEFTTDIAQQVSKDIHPQEDGSFIIDGGANIRELNRVTKWQLPIKGPKTLNGLVLEYLESIPNEGTCILINDYPIEVIQVADNTIKAVKIFPRLKKRVQS